MLQFRHCNLCEYPIENLKNGLTCGLTSKKPDFNLFCPNIKFSNSFKEHSFQLLNEIKQLEKRKKAHYFNFFLFALAGLLIILGSHMYLNNKVVQVLEREFNHSSWVYFSAVLFFYFVALQLLFMGFWPLNKNRIKLKRLKSDRKEINEVLKNYGITLETFSSANKS